MEQYICPESDIPTHLYRINYPDARTSFLSEEGFRAAVTTRTFGAGEMSNFKDAIEKDFTWSCRDPLPFISLFSDREHAENWGRKLGRGCNSSKEAWTLHIVDTSQLKLTTSFFKPSDLVKNLSVNIPERAQQHILGAFICMHRIPLAALIAQRSSEQVENGM